MKIRIVTSTFLIFYLQLFEFSESSSYKAEIRLKEFSTVGSTGRNHNRLCCDVTDDVCKSQCFFKFDICFSSNLNSLLGCFKTNFIPEDTLNRTTIFPEIISGNLSNILIVKISSLQVTLGVTIYSKDNNLFNHISSTLTFDSVGVEKVFEVNGGLNPRSPNKLILYGRLSCDGNFKPPECNETVCEEKNDDINGHYTCHKNGSIICREGWKDPSTNCRQRLFSNVFTPSIQLQPSQSFALEIFSLEFFSSEYFILEYSTLEDVSYYKKRSTVDFSPTSASLWKLSQSTSLENHGSSSSAIHLQPNTSLFLSKIDLLITSGFVVGIGPTSVKQLQQFQSSAFSYYGLFSNDFTPSIAQLQPSQSSTLELSTFESSTLKYFNSSNKRSTVDFSPTSASLWKLSQSTSLENHGSSNILPTTMSSSTGCTSEVIDDNSTGFKVICKCNNKEVFIMLPGTNLTECYAPSKLSIVSFVGCVNFAASIFLTIITYMVFRNVRKVPQKIFINSCFSMLFLVVTFLIGIKKTYQPRVCHAVSVLLHYFTLTTFGWMSVEFFSMYRNVFRLYQGSRFFWTMCVSTWVFSAIISGVTSSFTKVQFNGFNSNCYATGSMFIAFTIFPISCAVLLGVILFVKIIRKIQSHSAIMKKYRSRKILLTRIRFTFSYITLFSFAWMFGVLAVVDFRHSLQWIFSILNSLLGIYIYANTMKHVAIKKNSLPILSSRKGSRINGKETII